MFSHVGEKIAKLRETRPRHANLLELIVFRGTATALNGVAKAALELLAADLETCTGRHTFIGAWANTSKEIYTAPPNTSFHTGRAPRAAEKLAACFSTNHSDPDKGLFATSLFRKIQGGAELPHATNKQLWETFAAKMGVGVDAAELAKSASGCGAAHLNGPLSAFEMCKKDTPAYPTL